MASFRFFRSTALSAAATAATVAGASTHERQPSQLTLAYPLRQTLFFFFRIFSFFFFVGAAVASVATARASEGLHPPHLPWGFSSVFGGCVHANRSEQKNDEKKKSSHTPRSFDKAAVRRGYMVFTEVCQSCHSVDRLAFRNLVGVVRRCCALVSTASDRSDRRHSLRMRPRKPLPNTRFPTSLTL